MRYTLYLAWLLAAVGTLMSLYFSAVRHYEPCQLCWFQRIALFPLALILAIAAFRGFTEIALYTIPLVVIGLFFSSYQIAIQEIPGWNPIDLCGKGISCSQKVDIGLGPITIPMLSTILFLLIGILLFTAWRSGKRGKKRR